MSVALITGASAGLGAEYAQLFAQDGHDLILVARRADRLDEIAQRLREEHRIDVVTIALDLGARDAADALYAQTKEREVEFLVNNAGFGANGAFIDLNLERQTDMIRLNILTLHRLTRLFAADMVGRKKGKILNLGSTAGFVPGPGMATYYASKAFVNSFSEALAVELKGTGVTVTVSCPGPTATEFGAVAGNDKSQLFQLAVADAGKVAAEGYRAMRLGKPMVVHGLLNKFSVQSLRLSPRAAVRWIAGRLNAPA